jgi:chromate transporter
MPDQIQRDAAIRRAPVLDTVISSRRAGTPGEVFVAFLKLGCTAFGGPIAHLGYFQYEFEIRRKWIDEEAYADLVALCQFLSGPESRQVGLALGWKRAGWAGALAAWLAFTAPSDILMVGFAYGVRIVGDLSHAGWIQGLKVATVVLPLLQQATVARGWLDPDTFLAG